MEVVQQDHIKLLKIQIKGYTALILNGKVTNRI